MCFVYEKLATTLRGGSRSVQTDGGRPLVVYSAMAQSTLRKRSLQPLTSSSARQQAGTAQSVRLRRCRMSTKSAAVESYRRAANIST